MKKYTLILCLFLLGASFSGFAQNSVATVLKEPFKVSEKVYDFGKIPMGRPVTHQFTITNNGTDTLFIDNVTASCGCTTPVWKKAPVAPGETTNIEVGFNAAAEGFFDKAVTIFYNKGAVSQVSIKGNVYMRNATPVPANASVEKLKQLNW